MKIIKYIGLYVLVLVLAYFLSPWLGGIYQNVTDDPGTWADVSGIFGLVVGYIFFLLLLFTAFGDKHKYWWIGILLIPALWFEIYFDLPHLYFPLALGLLGWLIGLGLRKLFSGSV